MTVQGTEEVEKMGEDFVLTIYFFNAWGTLSRRMMDPNMKRINVWMVCCLISGVSVCAAMAEQVACLGQIVPGERMIRLTAPAGAIIGELRVQRGAQVSKEDVIAVLRDAPVYQAQLDRAKQQVALAEADLKRVRAGERPELIQAQQALIVAHQSESKFQENRIARYDKLLESQHVARDQYDELLSQHETLLAKIRREQSVLESFRTSRPEDVAKAEAAVRLAEAQAAEAAASLELQYIRAPSAGEILEVLAWPGESVTAGGAIVSLGDTQNMRVLAEVYESDLSRVKVGQRALIRGQAFQGEFGGEVVEIQKFVESSRIFPLEPSAYVDRRVVVVRIRPDDPPALAALSHAQVIVTIQTP
jgi:HlyD family secretion protein